jgi:hypothetical protein
MVTTKMRNDKKLAPPAPAFYFIVWFPALLLAHNALVLQHGVLKKLT